MMFVAEVEYPEEAQQRFETVIYAFERLEMAQTWATAFVGYLRLHRGIRATEVQVTDMTTGILAYPNGW